MALDLAPPPSALPAAAKSLTGATATRSDAALHKVAQDFEAMALNELLAPMFEGLSTDGLGGGGSGERMFRPMLVENYARGIAANGGVGIAAAVYRELVKLQEGNGSQG